MTPRLTGKKILVTRPRERAEALCFLLEDEGAEVALLPVLELKPPDDDRSLRAAAEQLGRYRWVLFASPSAVDAFVEAVREAGTSSQWLHVKIGAVGPVTGKAVRDAGLELTAQAERTTGEGLFEAIKTTLQPGDRVLLPAAQDGRRELEQALLEAEIDVTRVAAYHSGGAAFSPEELSAALEPLPDAAIFGSPRTVEAFLATAGERGEALVQRSAVVAIGPTTADALKQRGAEQVFIAQAPTAEGLVEATVSAASR